ncbi:MAG: TonB-dependent receptor plug domain-containing protein, partial [Oscillospiraceae bacterium]|nr:TonB-dependent receptor plug domain-containing protein [Oscillospiraceae bacterium]
MLNSFILSIFESMKKICLSAFLLLIALTPIFAQRSVTGTVRDEQGDPLPYASVWVKGSVQGSTADAEGKYTISVLSDNAVLVYSCLGYYDEEVRVKGRSVIDVQLYPLPLERKVRRLSYPGSADRLSSRNIELLPATSPLNILNGAIPGVRLTSPSGQPGSSASISIRGVGFEDGGNPLIVIDGIVYEGFLSSIPLSDIESISVLKDAASTTIYGAGAVNGVILISTKHSGPSNTPRIIAKVAHGFVSRQQKDYEVMDLKGYMESLWLQTYNNYTLSDRSPEESARMASASLVRNLGYNDDYYPWKGSVGINDVVGLDGKYNPDAVMLWGDDTDWRGATERIGQAREYGVSASGSSWSKLGLTEYFGSVNYLNSEGYMTGTGFERYSARANVSFTKKWLSFGVYSSASLSDMSGNLSTTEGALENSFYTALSIPPTYTVHRHRADGSYITDESGNWRYDFGEGYPYDGGYTSMRQGFTFNVAAYQEKRYSHYRRAIIDVHPFLKVSLPADLELTANAAVYNCNYTNHTAVPYYEDYLRSRTSVTMTHSQTRNWTTNQQLSWKHTFGKKHGLDLLLGHETRNYTYDYETTSKREQVIYGDNYQLNNYSVMDMPPSGESNNSGLDSWFARAKYSYRYQSELTGSFRRDADAVKPEYHYDIWSVGAYLDLGDFDLFPFDFNQTKLRASVGGVRYHFALPDGESKPE